MIKNFRGTKAEFLQAMSPAKIHEDICIERFQHFLDTGEYPTATNNKTWDMLAWLKWNREK